MGQQVHEGRWGRGDETVSRSSPIDSEREGAGYIPVATEDLLGGEKATVGIDRTDRECVMGHAKVLQLHLSQLLGLRGYSRGGE